MASDTLPVSRWCKAAFVFGLASLPFGVIGLCLHWSDLLLAACRFLALLTIVTAIVGLIHVRRQRGRVGGYGLALWGIGFPTAFFGLMSVSIWSAPEYRNGFFTHPINCLKQIVLAFHYYQQDHKRLPAAAICDADGKPLLSWRVAILPYIEQEQLFREFKLDEPWDSTHNIKLLERMPGIYQIEHRDTGKTHSTFFQVLVGPGTPFEPGLVCKVPDSFPDGTSNTLLIVEAGDAVPWTKPADMIYDADQALPPLGGVVPRSRFGVADLFGFGWRPPKGMFVALADGSVRWLNLERISKQTLRRVIVRNDGKEPGPDW